MRVLAAAAASTALVLCLLGCVSGPGPALTSTPAAAPIAAAAPVAATADPASIPDAPFDAPAGAYALDPRHTSVVWRVRHQNFSMFTGRFDAKAGSLDFRSTAPAQSKLTASVDAASISSGLNEKEGDLTFDQQIAKVLGVDKSPKITFTSTRITRTGEKTARIEGDMTMNGRTHAETIDATFEGYAKSNLLSAKPRFAFSGHAVIKRSDFGASNVVFSLFASDEVEVLIETEFEKAGG